METAMRNFVIAALAVFALAGFVTSAEARSKARAFTEAAEFAQELKSSGRFEIDSSNLALRTSNNDEIKKFAQKMVDDHTAADQKLTETLKQANLPELQYGMDAESRDAFEQLIVLQGSDFDRAYVRDQIKAHGQAIELLDAYSKSGDNDALKQLASTLLPTIKEHLQMAEGLRSNATARR
jgi:putative membrane protein